MALSGCVFSLRIFLRTVYRCSRMAGFPSFHSPASRWLAFSSFWVLFEWIRSFILTGFPWNLLGSVFAFSPEMIQFASQAGTYGLSLICLLSCSAPYFTFAAERKNLAAAICIPLVGLGFLYGFGYFRLPRHPLPQSATVIRLVQPAIPQAMKWNPQTLENNFQKYISMSKAPGREKSVSSFGARRPRRFRSTWMNRIF